MTRAEYGKVLELIRDNRDNVIEIAIGLNKMVTDEAGKPEKNKAKPPEEKKPKAEKKGKTKPTYKPKKCIVCGETFQPKNNRQMKCEGCLEYDAIADVNQEIKDTAAELAAMAK